MPDFPENVRTTLESRLEELSKINDLSEASRDTVNLDQQSVGRLSRIDALQQQAMAQATERQRRSDMARIRTALDRLINGEFGTCMDCGEDIPERRLEIDPTATLCMPCAKNR